MKSRRLQLSIAGVAFVVLLFLYVPLSSVVVSSFNSAPHGPWEQFTLKWYRHLLQDGPALQAARVTLLLAFGSTAISTLLGTMLALGMEGPPHRGKGVIETALMLPVIVPDILMDVALLLLFHQLRGAWEWFQPGLLTMTLAHVTFQIPFVALVVRARLRGFDAALDEAARDLGANRWQAFWHVKLPLLWPGILAGALLALTLSLDDFVVSFFTTGPGASTLPLLIYSSVKRGVTPEINAISSVFIAAAVAATFGLAALQRKPDARR